MADDVMREMNNNLKKKEQQGGNLAMKGEFLAAGIKSEVEGIKSALTDVYKWVRKCWLASTQTNFHSLRGAAYIKGDSMNGTPTVSWQRLCAIERVKLKVTKSSVES